LAEGVKVSHSGLPHTAIET